jgi:regulator of nucleoside diphosphate kinase
VSAAVRLDATRSRARIGAAQEDHLMNTAVDLPQVTIATHDYNRLMSIAAMENHQRRPHRQFLMSELRRASLCHPDALPDDVVSTNAKVTYRIDGGRPMAHVLVHPQDLLWPGAELSVLTPLGIALLGLRVGDRMPFRTSRDGPWHEVVVEDVRFRLLPEEAEAAWNARDPSGDGHGNSRDDPDHRTPAWTPQPNPLSREEMRKLVIDQIG